MQYNMRSRTNILLLMVFGFMVLLAAKLVQIQIVDNDKYIEMAQAQQMRQYEIRAQRGEIYARDADGQITPLVMNEPVYTIFADPQQIVNITNDEDIDSDNNKQKLSNVESMIKQLGDKATDNAYNQIRDAICTYSKKEKGEFCSQYFVVARNLSRSEATKIREAKMPGIGAIQSTRRVYIEGTMAAQTLGFVNSDGDGQYGIEQYMNDELRGKDGLLKTVTDAGSIPLSIGAQNIDTPAVPGENIVLTLDRNIQSQVEDSLQKGLENVKATKGSAIVMNPQNGEVMAVANFPSYDPANYGAVNDASIFQSSVVSDAYEPGSVTKALTIGAGMDSGAIKRDSTYPNTDCIEVDDAKICNVERGLNRTLTMTDILMYSLNTGVNWVLNQMGGGENNLVGRQKLYDYFINHYKFGKQTGIEQAGEGEGMLLVPDTVNGARVVYGNMVFGQGMNITTLQFASAFCAAINGGIYYQPHLVSGEYNNSTFIKKETTIVDNNVLKPEISQDLREMLRDARASYSHGAFDNGFYVGGKSGTAQVYNASTGKYDENMYVGTYVGFGADKSGTPKYVIMVRVDDSHAGGYAGSTAAMPIFNEISNYMIQYMGITK